MTRNDEVVEGGKKYGVVGKRARYSKFDAGQTKMRLTICSDVFVFFTPSEDLGALEMASPLHPRRIFQPPRYCCRICHRSDFQSLAGFNKHQNTHHKRRHTVIPVEAEQSQPATPEDPSRPTTPSSNPSLSHPATPSSPFAPVESRPATPDYAPGDTQTSSPSWSQRSTPRSPTQGRAIPRRNRRTWSLRPNPTSPNHTTSGNKTFHTLLTGKLFRYCSDFL